MIRIAARLSKTCWRIFKFVHASLSGLALNSCTLDSPWWWEVGGLRGKLDIPPLLWLWVDGVVYSDSLSPALHTSCSFSPVMRVTFTLTWRKRSSFCITCWHLDRKNLSCTCWGAAEAKAKPGNCRAIWKWQACGCKLFASWSGREVLLRLIGDYVDSWMQTRGWIEAEKTEAHYVTPR